MSTLVNPRAKLVPAKRPLAPSNAMDIHELHREISQCKQENASYNTQLSTLKTQKAARDLAICKLEDKYASVKEDLDVVQTQLQKLEEEEADALASIQNKYDLLSEEVKIEYHRKLMALTESTSSAIENIINENHTKLEAEKLALTTECTELKSGIQLLKTDLNRSLIRLKEDFNKKKLNLFDQITESIVALQQDITKVERLKAARTKDIASLREQTETTMAESTLLKAQIDAVNQEFKNQDQELADLESEIEAQRALKTSYDASAADTLQKINNLEQITTEINHHLAHKELQRRILHNQLQELKGNIRVFCRIKPSSGQLAAIDHPDNELNDDASQDLVVSKDTNTGSVYKFSFDKVFGMELTNHEVFDDLSQLIQSSLDGYNVCVFAYGQTGSGKTWTMSHPETGMIPLSIEKIFTDIEDLEKKGWTYKLDGEFVELYNDTIVDLLSSSTQKHEIKHDNNKTTITNVTSVSIESKKQAQFLINKAYEKRSTASTMANERSSRSHSIFILKISGTNTDGKSVEGVLNLVDLAGSERLSNSLAKGDRLKETQSINRSLSCLGDVIYALGQKQVNQHIPYRNSKLTYLLKNSLGGDSKTLMFVNVSPLLKDFNESVNSLRFATKVNSTHLK